MQRPSRKPSVSACGTPGRFGHVARQGGGERDQDRDTETRRRLAEALTRRRCTAKRADGGGPDPWQKARRSASNGSPNGCDHGGHERPTPRCELNRHRRVGRAAHTSGLLAIRWAMTIGSAIAE